MNERINDLFDKALDEVVPNTWTNLTMDQLNDIKNKFAELLIQQCCNAIVNDSRLSDVRTARNGCVRAIKEHFGVEE